MAHQMVQWLDLQMADHWKAPLKAGYLQWKDCFPQVMEAWKAHLILP
jgi:hypothetical protein